MTTNFLFLGAVETFKGEDGETRTVPSAETLADRTYVTTLQCLGMRLDEYYHRECKEALKIADKNNYPKFLHKTSMELYSQDTISFSFEHH